ncbi:MAG: lipid-A-disaccharide synthase [Methyloligellaceae bacterium]
MDGGKKIFIVTGEHSGDALGGPLMKALKARLGDKVEFACVGGKYMEEQGAKSIFPLSDIAVMGPIDIAKNLPRLIRRVYTTVDAIKKFKPDLLVIIDSPEFSHPIAKRIRKATPDVPIINYVSPSVWAWRPGRARKMKPYVDHILALLPFEPDAHKRLGGPDCTYVGHPMIERMEWMRSRDGDGLQRRLGLSGTQPVVVVLPGSRTNEVKRLMQPFGDTLNIARERFGPFQVIIPAVPSVRPLIEQGLSTWNITPHFVSGDDDKFAAFSLAHAALAASGTVTLEIALSGLPMVVGYKADWVVASVRKYLINIHSVVLANLVLGYNAFPEYIQEDCVPEKMSEALVPLLTNSQERKKQKEALNEISQKMLLDDREPSDAAADVVMKYL